MRGPTTALEECSPETVSLLPAFLHVFLFSLLFLWPGAHTP